MQKRLFLLFSTLLILSVFSVSAFWPFDSFKKTVTGNTVSTICTDTDGGIVPETFGTVVSSSGSSLDDSCFNGYAGQQVSSCSGNDCYVRENYCSASYNGILFSWNLCANGCSNGACISTTQSTCTQFTYSDWNTCSNGQQSRTVTSSLPAGCTGGSPVTTQSCVSTSPQVVYTSQDSTSKYLLNISSAGKSYYLYAIRFTSENYMNYTFFGSYTDESYLIEKTAGDSLYIGNAIINIISIDKSAKKITVSAGSNTQVSVIPAFDISSATCTDSDGGDNYYVVGETSSQTAGYWKDACLNNITLQEGGCGSLGTHTYNCPNGCKLGACIGNNAPRYIIPADIGVFHLRTDTIERGITADIVDYIAAEFRSLEFADGESAKLTITNAREYDSDAAIAVVEFEKEITFEKFKSMEIITKIQNKINDGGKAEMEYADTGDIVGNSEKTGKVVFFGVDEYGYVVMWVSNGKLIFITSEDYRAIGEDRFLAELLRRYLAEYPSNLIKSDSTNTCTDSDGGLNYDLKGNIRYFYNVSGDTFYGWHESSDSCSTSSNLIEFSCDRYSPTELNPSSNYECPDGCKDGACINSSSPRYGCNNIVNDIKNPSSFTDNYGVFFELNQNGTYTGSWNGNRQDYYKSYSAGWNGNDNSDSGSNMHYYIYKDVTVFDDSSSDAGVFIKDLTMYNDCIQREFSGKTVYVCNGNVLGREDYNYFEVILSSKNKLFRLTLMANKNFVSEEDLNKLSNLRTQQLVSDILDNKFKSTSQNFNLNYHFNTIIENMLDKCPSSLESGSGPNYLDCKIEPAVCPAHGIQNKICRSYVNDREEVKKSEIYCSPGICSGCAVPRWIGYDGGDNICMPYGFRFKADSGDKVFKLVEGTDTETIESNDKIILDVISATRAKMTILGRNNNFTYNLFLGESVDVTDAVIDLEGEKGIVSLVLTVDKIVYSSTGTSYIETSINYKRNEQSISTFNAYCDFDGKVKTQKSKADDGSLAECQNNYECTSNLCSNGECIDTKAAAEEESKFRNLVVRLLCKLSNMFDSEGYNSCIAES